MYRLNDPHAELQPESFEFTGEAADEMNQFFELESPFSDAEETELAAELLEVASEEELEQFLGKLFKRAWRGIKKIGSKIVRPLGRILKAVAKKALPFVAGAAGTFFGGPAGGAVAGKLGSLVSQALEAETAGLTPQDRDFEKCRHFVRMAGAAARAAVMAPPGSDPMVVAGKVLAGTSRRKLASAGREGSWPESSRVRTSYGQSLSPECASKPGTGRWIRRGRNIVIINCPEIGQG